MSDIKEQQYRQLRKQGLWIIVTAGIWLGMTYAFWIGYAGADDVFYARYAYLLHRLIGLNIKHLSTISL